jgi:hypothetical protein
MDLIPPQNFEGGHYRFVLEFKDLDELRTHRRKLDDVLGSQELGTILYG